MSRKKIIILTSRFPYPLDKGDKLRIYHQIKNISSNHDLYLISINTENTISESQVKELKPYCKKIYIFNIKLTTILFNLIKSFLSEPLDIFTQKTS